jgi:hypothetical protein
MAFLLHKEEAGTAKAAAAPAAGDLNLPVFFGFLFVVLVALVGAIVLYAIGKDSAGQVILPVGTGLLGLLTGQYFGEKAAATK